MAVYRKEGRNTYSYDFQYRGRRFSGSTDCTTKREAERYEEKVKQEARAATVDAKAPMTLLTACTLYWEQKGQFLANSQDRERYLAWLQEHAGKKTLLSDIGDAEVARLVAKRRGDGVANATVNRSVCEPLRAILRRAGRVWKQSVQTIEWSEHFLPEAQERVREASVAEEAQLTAKMRGDYGPALRFAFLNGCRRAEVVSLEWSRVNFFTREFTVVGKGNKARTIPMTQATYDLLWSLKDHHATAVFTYVCKMPREGQTKGLRYPITMEGFKTEWRRTKGRAKVADFRFHDTRHTAATRLVRATGNLKAAQKLLGHTELATTSRYAHVTNGDLLAGLEAVHGGAGVPNPTATPTEDAAGPSNVLEIKGKRA